MAVFNALMREKAGKGAARATRREGRVPAVIYGDKKDSVMISLHPVELNKEMHKEGFFSTVFDVEIEDGKAERAIAKDIQFHPVTDRPLHVDFQRVSKDSIITVWVPVHFKGEDVSFGLKRGGVLNIVRHEVEIVCKPDDIPAHLEIDLSEANIGDSFKISNTSLPEGVQPSIKDRDFVIATITGKGAQAEETDTAEESAEATEE